VSFRRFVIVLSTLSSFQQDKHNTMAWRSSGTTNDEMVENMKRKSNVAQNSWMTHCAENYSFSLIQANTDCHDSVLVFSKMPQSFDDHNSVEET
jgi:hypothetical protein